MRFLLTGGTGFIGTRFCEDVFKREGHEVVILTRGKKSSTRPALRYVQWDGQHIPDEVGEIDVIFNLAGANIADKSWSEKRKQILTSSRVDATQACVEFTKRQQPTPKVLLSCSAVGIYGGDNPNEMTEKDPPQSDFMGLLCQQWEAAAQGSPARTVIIRTPVVLDKTMGALPQIALPFKMFAGGPIGSGKQGFSWIHVQDYLQAIWYLIEHEELDGVFNVTAPQIIDNRQLSKALARALKRPGFLPAPPFAFKMLLGERAIIVLGGQKVVSQRLQELDFPFKYPTIDAALQQIYQNKS